MTVESPVQSAKGRWLKNILSSLAAVGSIFLLMELALRLAGFHPVNMDFQPAVYSSEFGWELKKNYRAVCEELHWKFSYRTNSRGFRDREHTFEKSPGLKRILVLGDSFTEGFGVREEERWASLLEKKWADGVEVVNLGVRGYDILQEYKLFLKTGLLYHSDWIIQVLNETDYLETPASFNLDVTRRFRPPYRFEGDKLVLLDGAELDYPILNPGLARLKSLVYHSALIVWLRRRLEFSSQSRSFLSKMEQRIGFRKIRPEDRAVSDYERNYPLAVDKVYRSLAELARKNGFRMLVVWIGEHGAPAGLRRSVLESGAGDWLEMTLPASLRFRYDPHPTPEGNRLIAARIFEKLKSLHAA